MPSPQQTPSHGALNSSDTLSREDFLESPPLFWYSPVPKLREESKQHYQRSQDHGMARRANTDQIPVPTPKKRLSLTHQRHQCQGSTIAKPDETMVLQSGNCSFKFKFRLLGIERLNVLFNEMQEFVATENRDTKPRNVQLDNPEAVKRLPADDGRCAKMSNWLKQKFGMAEKAETENETGGKKTGLSKYLQRSIEAHAKAENARPERYVDLKKRQASGGQFLGNFDFGQGTLLNLGTSDKDEKGKKKNKKDKKKKKEKQLEEELLAAPTFQGEITEIKKRFTKHATRAQRQQYWDDRRAYVSQYMPQIRKPFCNFADHYETIRQYKRMLRWDFKGDYTPVKIRVDCTLLHGCDPLLEGDDSTRRSKEVYLAQTVNLNQVIKFKELRYCQIPIKTRLAFSITLVFQENAELTIGCVSINLFDEKGQFRSGPQDLNIWPFYTIDERLGCMKEYNGMTKANYDYHRRRGTQHMLFSKLMLSFEAFICPMVYSSRDERKISIYKLTKTAEDSADEEMLQLKSIDNRDLANLKQFFEQSPLDDLELIEKEEKKGQPSGDGHGAKRNLFMSREHYQTYPKGLPIFLKSVKWNRPVQVNEVYNMLGNWAAMEPEDAIQLLDAKYPDEKVRQYAVQRLSLLSDDELRLYMLQFAQALLYEENHFSPLSEMLIMRSLRNPYVVGQAYFWTLKANLYLKTSYERYYVLLEQLLMTCGRFLNELIMQRKINRGLQSVAERVTALKEHKDKANPITLGEIEGDARLQLAAIQGALPSPFTVPIEPKFIAQEFHVKKLKVFSSAKSPLRVNFINQDAGGEVLKVMFKNGDDLRQDILTLQMIDIMDRIWLDHDLDLAMTPYKVVPTDCMQGYLEFNLNTVTLADI